MKNVAKKVCPDSRLGGWLSILDGGYIIYIIIRYLKPKIVVETGVGPGGTSSVILKALSDNHKGILYSIDLPGFDSIFYPTIGKNYNIHIPDGFDVGWLIPPWLKTRHILILGDSKLKLPELLEQLRDNNKKVDIFLHDSLHTDEHISFEFSTIFPHLNKDAILLCDDVNEHWSTEFIRICKKNNLPFIIFRNRLGISIWKQ
ncbi:MAG: class I SAM-dependent methyltransferase [Candidatus Omnitrophica bacterium]|nr:class I SAM-dependent methyltransferase [Candidatus Omnitrophota bacterium]